MPGRVHQESPTETEEDYTGHVKDNSTGLHYAGARYYSAAFGRWTTTDPILGEKGAKKLLNQDARLLTTTSYNYAFNDPVRLKDPDGRPPCAGVCTAAAIGALTGAGIEAAFQYATEGSVDGTDVMISGAIGGVTGGAGNYANGLRYGARAAQLAIGSLGSVAEGSAKSAANGEEYSYAEMGIDAGVGTIASGGLIGAKKFADDLLSSARKSAEEALSRSRDASKRASDAMWDVVLDGQTSKKTARDLLKKAQNAAQNASGAGRTIQDIMRLRTFRAAQWTGATVGGTVSSGVRGVTDEDEQ